MTKLTSKVEEMLREIVSVHEITREYIIKCETLAQKTFPQPVKEFRDAYDHILRTFFKNENDEEVIRNVEAALSHENRAFSDIMDHLCVKCKEIILKTARNNKKTFGSNSFYPHYGQMKKYLAETVGSITELLNARGHNKEVNRKRYKEIADIYYNICIDFVKASAEHKV